MAKQGLGARPAAAGTALQYDATNDSGTAFQILPRPAGSGFDLTAFDLTGAGPSPCKFGDRCRFFARGCCRNYHPQVPIEPLGEHNWYY